MRESGSGGKPPLPVPPAVPSLPLAAVPTVDRETMVEVDRIMEEDLRIALIQMMENAGRSLARLAQAALAGNGGRVLALAGSGGNGGGVLVAARRLAGWGFAVDVAPTSAPDRYGGVPGLQLAAVRAMGVTILDRLPAGLDAYAVVLDGVVGYSLAGPLRGRAAEAAARVNASARPLRISLDVPSGFDSVTGAPTPGAFAPDAILTVAAPKAGLATAYPDVPLYLADISVPASVFARIGDGPFAPPADITLLEPAT